MRRIGAAPDITRLQSLTQNCMAGNQTRLVCSKLDTQDVLITRIWTDSLVFHPCDIEHCHVCFSQALSRVTEPAHMFIHAFPTFLPDLGRADYHLMCLTLHVLCMQRSLTRTHTQTWALMGMPARPAL